MKWRINTTLSTLAFSLAAATLASAQNANSFPSADDVVARMMQRDAQRQSELGGYTAIRHYVAGNKKHVAEMLVRVNCASDGQKQFTVLSEEGSGTIRKHVFDKMLSDETEAYTHGARNDNRITPANYRFRMIGEETVSTGPVYVLAVSPKTENKFLIDGKIWVDGSDYSIVRIEGQPARNPSFWVRSTHFVYTYQKVGQFWFAASTRSTSDLRIFGISELTIETTDYKLKSPENQTAETNHPRRLAQ